MVCADVSEWLCTQSQDLARSLLDPTRSIMQIVSSSRHFINTTLMDGLPPPFLLFPLRHSSIPANSPDLLLTI